MHSSQDVRTSSAILYPRVKLGLKRDNPFLITPEVEENVRNLPPIFAEKDPWMGRQGGTAERHFVLPTHEDKDDPRTDPDFLAKDILQRTPHSFYMGRCSTCCSPHSCKQQPKLAL